MVQRNFFINSMKAVVGLKLFKGTGEYKAFTYWLNEESHIFFKDFQFPIIDKRKLTNQAPIGF